MYVLINDCKHQLNVVIANTNTRSQSQLELAEDHNINVGVGTFISSVPVQPGFWFQGVALR